MRRTTAGKKDVGEIRTTEGKKEQGGEGEKKGANGKRVRTTEEDNENESAEKTEE